MKIYQHINFPLAIYTLQLNDFKFDSFFTSKSTKHNPLVSGSCMFQPPYMVLSCAPPLYT